MTVLQIRETTIFLKLHAECFRISEQKCVQSVKLFLLKMGKKVQ